MKCACNSKMCTAEVFIDASGATLLVERKELDRGREYTHQILICVDPELCVNLIRQLKEMLLNFTEVQ